MKPDYYLKSFVKSDQDRQVYNDLVNAREKMVITCQHGAKKAWRKYGKQVYKLSLQLGVPIDPWLAETFARRI